MSNEITSHNQDILSQKPIGIISENDKSIKVLRISSFNNETNFRDMLAAAVQLFNMGDIIGKIKKGTEFVVQIPTQYQAKFQAGTLEMLRGSKSGKTWATLVRKLPDGKQEFIANCPIKEQMRLHGNPIQDLAGSFQNLYMQQKLAELSEQVQNIYNVVLQIEQGQMDDRIGKLLSGRDDIQRALKNPNNDDQRRELELARSKLSEAQHQIGQVFKTRIEKFKPIPENKIVRRLLEIQSPTTTYMKKQDEEFEKLQEYFEFYLRATQLLAWSYIVVGDTDRVNIVFEQSKLFLHSIDFSNVQTLDYIYPSKSMDDAFYHQTISYMEAEKVMCLETAHPYEYVQITASSEELQEVIVNGKAV